MPSDYGMEKEERLAQRNCVVAGLGVYFFYICHE